MRGDKMKNENWSSFGVGGHYWTHRTPGGDKPSNFDVNNWGIVNARLWHIMKLPLHNGILLPLNYNAIICVFNWDNVWQDWLEMPMIQFPGDGMTIKSNYCGRKLQSRASGSPRTFHDSQYTTIAIEALGIS